MTARISPLRDFLGRESTSGLLVLVAAALGLTTANSPLSEKYFSVLDFHIAVGSGWSLIDLSVLKVINYLFMSIFFFVVGLEIKRELTAGHLASLKKAMLPFVAALGGMALPALIYLVIAGEWPLLAGGTCCNRYRLSSWLANNAGHKCYGVFAFILACTSRY